MRPGHVYSEADWAQDAYPGILLRRQEKGGPEKVSRVPPDRDLQAAFEWAAKEFFNPDEPTTPPIPESLLRKSVSPPTASPRMRDSTGRLKLGL